MALRVYFHVLKGLHFIANSIVLPSLLSYMDDF